MIPIGLVGMLHLPVLPGRPNYHGQPLAEIVEHAVTDATTLAQAGFDALMIQNTLDRPTRERVDAATIAQMTRICVEVRSVCNLPISVNVYRNDGPGAIAIAAAVGAESVRCKVHTGCVLSAEGLVSGCAEETVSMRHRLGASIQIWADIHDPISRPLPGDTLEVAANDAVLFGCADALIITRSTIHDTLRCIESVRRDLPETPMIVGGRTDVTSIREAFAAAEGVIVGNVLKVEPGVAGPVNADLAQRIVDEAHR